MKFTFYFLVVTIYALIDNAKSKPQCGLRYNTGCGDAMVRLVFAGPSFSFTVARLEFFICLKSFKFVLSLKFRQHHQH